MGTEIFNLYLVSPLFYCQFDESGPLGFGGAAGGGTITGPGEEKLFCYELDEAQYRSIEPDGEKLIKKLVFGGKTAGSASGEKILELPGGKYLFAQKRENLSREETLAMAVEVQQEGLWQRLEIGNRLYLRYLFEDGRMVTQIYRPYSNS